MTGNSRLFKSKTARVRQWCINTKKPNPNWIRLKEAATYSPT